MKAALRLTALASICLLLLSACEKKEKPYPLPPPGDALNAQVNIGQDYEMQIFFSFENGLVDSSRNDSWDLCFTNEPQVNEIRTNSGNEVYLKATGSADFSTVTDTLTGTAKPWRYDDPSGLKGSSGLGDLVVNNHLNEVLLVKIRYEDADSKKRVRLYKLQVSEANDGAYIIKADTLTGTTGTTYVLERDNDYNFTYFSFRDGIVKPEPPKTTWDIVFTRYVHLYRNYNPDGSDFPYPVNGVLLNPYRTIAGDDSTRNFNFNEFALGDAEQFALHPNRDVIGYDWKSVDISTGKYTVLPDKIFVVSTQQNALWKLHFVNFYKNGLRGHPQFEYKRLR